MALELLTELATGEICEGGIGRFGASGLKITKRQRCGGPGRTSILSVAADGVAEADQAGDLNLQFFWARGSGPFLGSPVPSGQKRNHLERYVETQPTRIHRPNSHPGTASARAVGSGL